MKNTAFHDPMPFCCKSIYCYEKPEVIIDGYPLCRDHAAARVAATPDTAVERHIRMLEWAKATASAPDDQTITIPSEFDRAEAMYALEQEIMRGMQAKAFSGPLIPLTKAGQGRDPIDSPWLVRLSVTVAVSAIIALCVVLYFFAGRVLP